MAKFQMKCSCGKLGTAFPGTEEGKLKAKKERTKHFQDTAGDGNTHNAKVELSN